MSSEVHFQETWIWWIYVCMTSYTLMQHLFCSHIYTFFHSSHLSHCTLYSSACKGNTFTHYHIYSKYIMFNAFFLVHCKGVNRSSCSSATYKFSSICPAFQQQTKDCSICTRWNKWVYLCSHLHCCASHQMPVHLPFLYSSLLHNSISYLCFILYIYVMGPCSAPLHSPPWNSLPSGSLAPL